MKFCVLIFSAAPLEKAAWLALFLNSSKRGVYDLPVCQIRVCICLHINLLAAVTRWSSTHYYYRVTSLTTFLLVLLMQKYIFNRRYRVSFQIAVF